MKYLYNSSYSKQVKVSCEITIPPYGLKYYIKADWFGIIKEIQFSVPFSLGSRSKCNIEDGIIFYNTIAKNQNEAIKKFRKYYIKNIKRILERCTIQDT